MEQPIKTKTKRSVKKVQVEAVIDPAEAVADEAPKKKRVAKKKVDPTVPKQPTKMSVVLAKFTFADGKYLCGCGASLSKSSLGKHLGSKSHLQKLELKR
jgi:hypothetical protein